MNSQRTRAALVAASVLVAAAGVMFLVRRPAEQVPGAIAKSEPPAAVHSGGPWPSQVTAPAQAAERFDPSAPYYARTFTILLKGANNKFHLSDSQVAYLQRCYTKFVEDRLALEASIAKVTSVTAEKTEIEIPSYSDAGLALEADFYQALETQFGTDLTDHLRGEYGYMIDADNDLVGQEPQVLTVSVVMPDRLYEVHHTIISSLFDRTLVDTFSPDNPGTYKALLPLFPKI